MGVYLRVDNGQQATNTFTLGTAFSQEIQEWVSDYAPDLSALANVLTSGVYNAIVYQYNIITSAIFTNANPGDFGTITGDNGGVISSTSSPTITDMDLYPLIICLPVDSSGHVIYGGSVQYVYDNSNYDTEFPLTEYQAWNGLGAVAVDILYIL